MIAIKTIVQNGRIEVAAPRELHDGTEVLVELTPLSPEPVDGDQPMTPGEIANILAIMDQVQPFDMTTAEIAALEADRQARKNWEKAHFNEHADRLRRMWE